MEQAAQLQARHTLQHGLSLERALRRLAVRGATWSLEHAFGAWSQTCKRARKAEERTRVLKGMADLSGELREVQEEGYELGCWGGGPLADLHIVTTVTP